ncbi:hypothetical protein ACP4OV_007515 [Aristida adscensionis]
MAGGQGVGPAWRSHGRRSQKGVASSNGKYSFGNPELIEELNSIVRGFTDHQKELAVETGFGSFVEGLHVYRFDMQFCMWLISKVDTLNNLLRLEGGMKLRMSPEDVSSVLGVPCGGKRVWDCSLDKSRKTHARIRSMLGVNNGREAASLAAARTLMRGKSPSNKEEDDAFKVAFIVYVVSMLIETKTGEEPENNSYFPALAQIESVNSFNWAFYILEEITLSCWQAISEQKNGSPPRPSLGTVLFIQLFYLDNMDYGEDSIRSGQTPRMHAFTNESLSRLVMADTAGLKGVPPARVFGKGKPRARTDLVSDAGREVMRQSSSAEKHGAERACDGASQTSLVEKLVSVPTPPAAEPKRTSKAQLGLQGAAIQQEEVKDPDARISVAVKLFKARCLKQLMTAKKSIDAEADKLVSTVCSVLKEDPPVCNAALQNNLSGREREVSPTTRVGASGIEPPPFDLLGDESPSLDSTPVPASPNSCSPVRPKKMCRRQAISPVSKTKLLCDSFLWAKRAIDEINLNAVADNEYINSPIRKVNVSEQSFVAFPWAGSHRYPRRDMSLASDFYSWATRRGSALDSIWVRHEVPNFIEVTGAQLVAQFSQGGQLEPEVCDLLFRVFYQTDCSMQQDRTQEVCRHFIESDFAIRVLADENFTASRSVRKQFTGPQMTYNIARCQLMLCMVKMETNWVAVAWDMKRKQVTVFAPGYRPTPGQLKWAAHGKIVEVLHDALGCCLQSFYEGWPKQWAKWPKIFLESKRKVAPVNFESWPDSGIMALQFCRTFDGVSYSESGTDQGAPERDRAELLYDLLHVKNNRGSLPPEFIQHVI